MRVSDDYLESVCFLCVKVPVSEAEDKIEFLGTGLIVSIPTRFQTMRMFCLVTAKHLLRTAREAGQVEIYVRINTKYGPSVIANLPDEWYYSENPAVDVAITWLRIVPGLQVRSVDLENFATDEIIQKESIGIGDEVFAIGLFNKRSGEQRNIPIMRTGIIASMPTEPLTAEEGQHDAYLVELRSIGGLSGSPVFVNLPYWRPGPNMVEARISLGEMKIRSAWYLLGIVRGHWDLEREGITSGNVETTLENAEMEKLNTGIANVTPIKDVSTLSTAKR